MEPAEGSAPTPAPDWLTEALARCSGEQQAWLLENWEFAQESNLALSEEKRRQSLAILERLCKNLSKYYEDKLKKKQDLIKRAELEGIRIREDRDAVISPIRDSLNLIASDMLAYNRLAYTACMKPPWGPGPSLIDIAREYKTHLDLRRKSAVPGDVIGGLARIRNAANELCLALLQAPHESLAMLKNMSGNAYGYLDQFKNATGFANDANIGAMPDKPHDEKSAWVRQLKGLEFVASLLENDLSNSDRIIGQKIFYYAYSESPDTRLFRKIMRLLKDKYQEDRHLIPIARVVRAWALGLAYGEQGLQEASWGNREPSRVRKRENARQAAMSDLTANLIPRLLAYCRQSKYRWIISTRFKGVGKVRTGKKVTSLDT